LLSMACWICGRSVLSAGWMAAVVFCSVFILCLQVVFVFRGGL
jgi:hypothetical protein